MSNNERSQAVLEELKKDPKLSSSVLGRKYGITKQAVDGIKMRAVVRGDLKINRAPKE